MTGALSPLRLVSAPPSACLLSRVLASPLLHLSFTLAIRIQCCVHLFNTKLSRCHILRSLSEARAD